MISITYVPNITILPRTTDPLYITPKIKKSKGVWNFRHSIFKDWRRDDEVKIFLKIFIFNIFFF